jgi:hypothetical protein
MRKWSLAGVAVCAAMLIAPGGAIASAKHIPVTIYFDGTASAGDGTTIFTGHIKSRNVTCRIALVQLISDPFGLLDEDLASFNGAWALRADPTASLTLTAKATRFEFGRRNHRKVCDPATVDIPLA